MLKAIKLYVRYVDAFNRRVGRFAMYLLFPMGALLIYSTVMRVLLDQSVNWVMEMSQFSLSAYYLLGGAYSMQIDAHVRMDLFYSSMSARTRATTDAMTVIFVIFYLVVLLGGGISATEYAFTYGQKNYTAWAPVMWPVKPIMTAGVFLMLLQTISTFFKDASEALGRPIA